jgi:hypothetical protein
MQQARPVKSATSPMADQATPTNYNDYPMEQQTFQLKSDQIRISRGIFEIILH